jgi:hypothetical protein
MNKMVLSLSLITIFSHILLGIAEFKIDLLETQNLEDLLICCVLKLITRLRIFFGESWIHLVGWNTYWVFTQSKKKDEGLRVRLTREANTAMLRKLVWIKMIHAKYFANLRTCIRWSESGVISCLSRWLTKLSVTLHSPWINTLFIYSTCLHSSKPH